MTAHLRWIAGLLITISAPAGALAVPTTSFGATGAVTTPGSLALMLAGLAGALGLGLRAERRQSLAAAGRTQNTPA